MNFEKDEIIQITYWKRTPVPADYVMREASKMLSSYLHNYALIGHTGADQMDPVSAMEHFRIKARHMMEGHGTPVVINAQIGQAESKRYMQTIQTDPLFIRWEDPVLANALLAYE